MGSPVWSVPRASALKWRSWDGHFVVFDPASGDTHFLNGIAGAILKHLELEPTTVEAIVKHLETVAEQPLDRERVEQIHELVEKLDAAGLIEPMGP